MKLIDYFRREKVDNIIKRVNKKHIVKRYVMLFIGTLIAATSFNLFFLKYDLACFGVSGISVVLSKFGVNPTLFIMLANIFLLIISFIFLGKEDTKNQIIGSILYPILVEITSRFTDYINLDGLEMVVIAVLGGGLTGIGFGIIYKSNFSTGGSDVIIQIIVKYAKISTGNAGLIVNACIILFGKLVFDWDIILYAVLVSYLVSIFTDKVLLGISKSKAFYIVTTKEHDDRVRDFLVSLPNVGTTIIDAEGGYSNDEKTLLLAVVPTRDYFIVKEGLKEIDNNIFFLVCDSYEVSNNGGI